MAIFPLSILVTQQLFQLRCTYFYSHFERRTHSKFHHINFYSDNPEHRPRSRLLYLQLLDTTLLAPQSKTEATINKMPSQQITEQQKELDLILIRELVERVAEFRREGKSGRVQYELHRRRLRQYYADLGSRIVDANDGGESSTPRRCAHCQDLRISNHCLKNGGCDADKGKRPA
ncbi:hypothetical protein F4814DRAFT_447395 [Daldinia grandis]|nr:hypothetical protein F4814DRAFT_447395 [Daldinia grandis]